VSGLGAYALGLVTLPFLVALLLGALSAGGRGKEIECRACGYSTGPMQETRRATCWVRWRWHKLTTGHHTRRWLRAQKHTGLVSQ
jgi:hypothetical protein